MPLGYKHTKSAKQKIALSNHKRVLVLDDPKICTECKESKPRGEFYKNGKKHIESKCKECSKKEIRNLYLKRTYGLSENQYKKLLNNQGNGCAICGKKTEKFNKHLAVDHDKSSGIIRGILCENCNRGIGLLNHSVELLKQAMNYLNQFN